MGLGNVGISENYPEVSKDVMESKLSILKKRFLSSYNSDIKDEITNIGAFFDKNNQYNDKTSINTDIQKTLDAVLIRGLIMQDKKNGWRGVIGKNKKLEKKITKV